MYIDLRGSCCFQCGKVNKFESDSQHVVRTPLLLRSCFQCGKVNKFESDSQHKKNYDSTEYSCFQCGKVNKFESDSQRVDDILQYVA